LNKNKNLEALENNKMKKAQEPKANNHKTKVKKKRNNKAKMNSQDQEENSESPKFKHN
jgi:hypothetical protein